MSDTYADVDGAADVADAVAWQERVDRWPAVRAYKERMAALLAGPHPVLDVGCGPGLDVVALGSSGAGALAVGCGPGIDEVPPGSPGAGALAVGVDPGLDEVPPGSPGAGALAVGVDRSAAMCARAAAAGAPVVRADAAALPFPDGAFGATRCDRVLQHLDRPADAVAELVRVTRPGGRVVVADPDQGSLLLAVPGARPALVAKVAAARRDLGYRHGTLARHHPATLAAAGLVDVTVDAVALVLDDPDDAFGIRGWPAPWGFPADEVDEWGAAVDAARGRGFVYALTYVVASGRVR